MNVKAMQNQKDSRDLGKWTHKSQQSAIGKRWKSNRIWCVQHFIFFFHEKHFLVKRIEMILNNTR